MMTCNSRSQNNEVVAYIVALTRQPQLKVDKNKRLAYITFFVFNPPGSASEHVS